MKVCPKCGRKYEEENAKYCLNEGATLEVLNDETETVTTVETVPPEETLPLKETIVAGETVPPKDTALAEEKVSKGETVPKKKSNKVWIIIIVAVILVGGIAFGAMKYFDIGKEEIMNFLGIEQTVAENKQEDKQSETGASQEEIVQINVSEIEETESQIENDESQTSSIETELEQLKEDSDLPAGMIDSLKKVIEEKQKEITGLKDKIKKQEREIIDLKDKINKLEKEVVDLKVKIKKLENQRTKTGINAVKNMLYKINRTIFAKIFSLA